MVPPPGDGGRVPRLARQPVRGGGLEHVLAHQLAELPEPAAPGAPGQARGEAEERLQVPLQHHLLGQAERVRVLAHVLRDVELVYPSLPYIYHIS